MERPLVLVVDDQEANRELCREALGLHGYEVVAASGVREAEEILAAREVEAVVCDVSMPHNGVRVYEYLLQNHPELRGRFIFMTGSAENFARSTAEHGRTTQLETRYIKWVQYSDVRPWLPRPPSKSAA